MSKTKTIRTILLAASVAALGAFTTAGAAEVSASDKTIAESLKNIFAEYSYNADGALGDLVLSADGGADLGKLAVSVEDGNVVFSAEGGDAVEVGTFNIDLNGTDITSGEPITIQYDTGDVFSNAVVYSETVKSGTLGDVAFTVSGGDAVEVGTYTLNEDGTATYDNGSFTATIQYSDGTTSEASAIRYTF